MELVRAECSSRLGAALGNALMHDLQHFFKPEINLSKIILDKCKLDRAKSNVKVICEDIEKQRSKFCCIGVDGKIDSDTLTFKESMSPEGEVILKKCIEAEHHLTFTHEDGNAPGMYLTHCSIPLVGATGEVLAQETYNVLEEYDSLQSITAILLDNTSVNTGTRGGLVAKLQEALKRNIHLIGCSLHQNELPLKALIKNIDGSTTGPTSFSGPLGSKCSEDLHELPQVNFEVVPGPLNETSISRDVLDDLSSDQRLLFEYANGIGSGHVNDKWASWKIGPLNHARWLTLAIRLMFLYTRNNEPTVPLKKLIHYIVNIYAPCWFAIKTSSKLRDSPRILYSAIQRLNALPYDDVKRIVKQNIQGNAFCLLPENFLYAMVCDDQPSIRKAGLQTVLKQRSR